MSDFLSHHLYAVNETPYFSPARFLALAEQGVVCAVANSVYHDPETNSSPKRKIAPVCS